MLDTVSALTSSRLLSSHLLYWTPLSWSCMLGLGGCSEWAEGGRGLHGRRGDGGRHSGLIHCRAQPWRGQWGEGYFRVKACFGAGVALRWAGSFKHILSRLPSAF